MKKRILALAFGLFAIGAGFAVPVIAAAQCVPVRCTIDPVTKQKRCTLLCPGGSLILQ